MWQIHFVPRETDHIDVSINGSFFHTWHSSDGDVIVPLVDHKDDQKIHVLAVGQEGKNGKIEVLWFGDNKQTFEFDGADGENHDVEQ